jgi:hypothetical protein
VLRKLKFEEHQVNTHTNDKKILLTIFFISSNHQLFIIHLYVHQYLAMNKAITSVLKSHDAQTHYFTFTRVKIQSAVKFCDAMKILYFKKDLFRVFDALKQTDWKMLTRENFSRIKNNVDISKIRERHSVMTSTHIRDMKRILETKNMKTRALTWAQLSYEMRLKCSDRTTQRVMRTINYYKCVACRRNWVNLITTNVALIELLWWERYSDDENWFSVRFRNEIHFSYESQKKIRIIRKSSQRYCQDCLQETNESTEKDLKKKNAWAAVSHDFKSDIRLYDVSSNTNEKMSQLIYIDQILKLVVKSWLDKDDDFCLKEDNDSEHDINKNNIVRKWKQEDELKNYLNCVFWSFIYRKLLTVI